MMVVVLADLGGHLDMEEGNFHWDHQTEWSKSF